ncbi:TIGR00730 family Rossman fold protein [Limnobacter parvus]|uniref:Cytokinin riboside 5'-monophosphate phosphoribohydrolase n=1 Tax=Limnobacter parvus TaxID=2939690 RepID=A0ABT1XFG9_9BURK|nr:TIGR00730 family Rossman fold protein [Limnobacter parvus]MCR2745614.1 TIGR00730 family Rossman fold protein [Limnobacter parvus]
MKNICVYCGSSPGNQPTYAEGAKSLARALVENNFGLVYGGSNLGLMGVVAEEVLALGGRAIGIIPETLVSKELAHPALTELFVTRNMHERKAMMAEMSDGFIALPGGLGTFEELFEILTWGQLSFHNKPVGVLNVNGYYDGLLSFLDHASAEAFIRPQHRSMLMATSCASELLAAFKQYQAPAVVKWV